MKNFQLNFITNKSLVRWLQILDELEKNSICNANRLANITNSTTRTIGKDIYQIRSYFQKTISIQSTHNGYLFKQFSATEYAEKKASLLSEEPLFVILEKIFFRELYSVEEWADYLHLSKNTFLKYIQHMQNQLFHFDLEVILDPVNIIGNEADVRNFFCKFFYESDITPHTVFPSAAAQQAVNEMSDLFENESYQNTSFSLYTYLLYISIERYTQGNVIDITEELHHALRHSVQLFHFQKINTVIDTYYGFKLSENELIFLFVCVITQRKLGSLNIEHKFCLSYNHWPQIGALTNEFFEILDNSSEDNKKDHILLESFFTTAKLKECISDSANKNTADINTFVKQTFTTDFDKYYKFLENNIHYNSLYSSKYLVDFCTNLVIYVETIRETYWQCKMNIAFIFEGNNNITQFFEALAKKYFGHYQNVFFPNSGEVNQLYLKKHHINLVITNYYEHIEEFSNITECILFKTIPDASDWNRLLEKINPKITNQYLLSDKNTTV